MDSATEYQVFHVPVELIHYDPKFNCRGLLENNQLLELVESIRDHSLQLPIIIQPREVLPDGCKYRIISGHRRFVACTAFLKWKTIPAIINTQPLSDDEIRFLNLVENVNRQDLSQLETAYVLTKFMDDGYSIYELAKRLHRSQGWICTQLNILKLVPFVQTLAIDGKLTSMDIDLLASFPPEKQEDSAYFLLNKREQVKNRKKTPGIKRKRIFEVRKMAAFAMRKRCKIIARALFWVVGELSDKELKGDINNNATGKNVSRRKGTCLPPEAGDN